MYDNENYYGYGAGNNNNIEKNNNSNIENGYFNKLENSNNSNSNNDSNNNSVVSGIYSGAQVNGFVMSSATNNTNDRNTNTASTTNTTNSTYATANVNNATNTSYQREDYRDYGTYQMGGNSSYDSRYTESKQSKEKKSGSKAGAFVRKMILSISLGLFFGLFAGIGFYAVQQGNNLLKKTEGTVEVVENTAVPGSTESGIKLTNTNNITVVESDISHVVEEVMPAMVSIINSYTETGSFWGQTYSQQQESSGSGIIVAENDSELLIVSNNHVVADAEQLIVTFIDGTEAQARIKGLDSDMDLAVIAVPISELTQETRDAISIATLGDSDELKLGEPVIAIGNALGYGQSVTNGIVSALDREITMEDGATSTFIQTNAAINPGNSGGALLNINGEVIGINSNKIGGSVVEGMGYAIPITSASPIISDLMERQTRNKVEEAGYIGISFQEVTDNISAMYNMPKGIYVVSVEENSAAQMAGIMAGDIITKFDGDKITAYADLQNVLQYYAAGDSAEITVMRPENGRYVQYDLQITLGSRPASAN